MGKQTSKERLDAVLERAINKIKERGGRDFDDFWLVAWPPFGPCSIRGFGTYPDPGSDISKGACFIRV